MLGSLLSARADEPPGREGRHMMLVKAARGDGSWELFEAGSELSYLDSHHQISVLATEDYEYGSDERFPSRSLTYIFDKGAPVLKVKGKDDVILVRWVRWWCNKRGESMLLITAHAVFICNEQGDTVEALR